jgi:hypothetical protein
VSDLERRSGAETLARDVVQALVDKCVDPTTGRPYTAGVLERALRAAHVALDPKRSAKQQALEALPLLQAQFPIVRARMRFRLQAPTAAAAALQAAMDGAGATVEAEETRGGSVLVTCVADPGCYRAFEAFARSDACAGGGRLEVLSQAVFGGQDGADAEPERLPVPVSAALPVTAVDEAASQLRAAVLLRDPPRASPAPADPGPLVPAFTVVYPRGPVAKLPEAHAARRERFSELEALQPGWSVELRARAGGGSVDALFFSPDGELHKSFADARRRALAHSKAK